MLKGLDVGWDQTVRLMRTAGLYGITKPRRHKVVPLGDRVEVTENIVDRNFDPVTEDTGDSDVRVWCGDITQIATGKAGWAYVAIVMCLGTRRVIGVAVASHMRTSLVIEA